MNINDLEKEWGLSRNGIKNRAKALGVQLLRPSHHETCWPAEYLEAGRDLDRWVKSGKPLADYPAVAAVPSLAAVPSPAPLATVQDQASDLVALLEAVSSISSPKLLDPLRTAQGLRAAFENELSLTSDEMASLLGRSRLTPDDDGMSPRPGFVIHRSEHPKKKTHKRKAVFWTVTRV